MSTDRRAKDIYDRFMMKLFKRNDFSFWLVDIRDRSSTPKVVVERYSDGLKKWRAFVFNPGGDDHMLCEKYDKRKDCVAMAERKLAQYLAEIDEVCVRDGFLWINGESFLIENPSMPLREAMEKSLADTRDYIQRVKMRADLLEDWLKSGAVLKEQ